MPTHEQIQNEQTHNHENSSGIHDLLRTVAEHIESVESGRRVQFGNGRGHQFVQAERTATTSQMDNHEQVVRDAE